MSPLNVRTVKTVHIKPNELKKINIYSYFKELITGLKFVFFNPNYFSTSIFQTLITYRIHGQRNQKHINSGCKDRRIGKLEFEVQNQFPCVEFVKFSTGCNF